MKSFLPIQLAFIVVVSPLYAIAQAQVQWCVVNNIGGTVVPGFCYTSRDTCESMKTNNQSCVAMPKTN
jgi:hypothetical protein